MTINQIAEICSVSKKTVSRVINSEPNVREEIRSLVLKTIKEHNYRPNVYARNMNRKAIKNILISIWLKQDFDNTVCIQQLLNHLTEAAQFSKFRDLVET